MKKSNKIVAVLLALVMIISAVPMMTASAAACEHKYIKADEYKGYGCTENDWTQYVCVLCGDDVTVISGASEHKDLGRIKNDGNPEAHYQICGDCGEYVYSEHKFVDVKITADATCTAYGTKKVKCSDCGFTMEGVEIAPKGHDFETIIVNGNNHTGKCKVCNETLTEPHNWDDGEVTAKAQCAANGVITYTCTDCGSKKAVSDATAIKALIGNTEKAAEDAAKIKMRHTYAEKGYGIDGNKHRFVCTVPGCGHVATEAEMNELGKSLEHDFVVKVLSTSSCSVAGKYGEYAGWYYEDTLALHITCKDCNLDIKTKNAEHDFDEFEKENDKQHVQICDKCGKEQIADHNWKDVKVVKAASCTEAGEKIVMCKDCEFETSVAIPKLEDHPWNAGTVTAEPTCGKAGSKEFKCTACDKTKTEEIPATGAHTWSEWKITIPATPLTEGVKSRECSYCGEKETKSFKYGDENIEQGDINEDGNVTAVDARIVLQIVAGIRVDVTARDLELADMNGDGNLTAVDARYILQIVAGLR